MPWVEVQCPNEKCPGRELDHPTTCMCKGTRQVMRDDGPGMEPCDAEAVEVPETWSAFWFNSTLTRAGEWDSSIHCPRCGEEGEDAD